MKRTTLPNLPDAINKSITKEFTQVPNKLIRNPDISAKAKTILSIMLSNRDGWKSYLKTIQSMMREGETAINSGVKELQEHGYLKKIRIRDKHTKQVKGSFWAYTDVPNQFNSINDHIKIIEKYGMEIMPCDWVENEDSHPGGNPDDGNLDDGNQGLRILNKEYQKKEEQYNCQTLKNPSLNGKNDPYLPTAKKLSNIIQSNKNIKHTSTQIKSWADEIRKLVESQGVELQRINKALDWYEDNIGGQYIPVIESGASLRSKFIKLENAIERGNQPNNGKPKLAAGYKEAGKVYPKTN